MTEQSASAQLVYFDMYDVQTIYEFAYQLFLEQDESIEEWEAINHSRLDIICNTPRQSISGLEMYPTIFDKAAIILYTINKDHLFPNGNKRLSIQFSTTFLVMNGYSTHFSEEDAYNLAIQVAESSSDQHKSVLKEISCWFEKYTTYRV